MDHDDSIVQAAGAQDLIERELYGDIVLLLSDKSQVAIVNAHADTAVLPRYRHILLPIFGNLQWGRESMEDVCRSTSQ